MIDYLEQSLERTRQLLEEIRRLERPLTGAGAEKDPDGPGPADRGRPLNGENQAALGGDRPAEEPAPPGAAGRAEKRASPGGVQLAEELAFSSGVQLAEEMTSPGGERPAGEEVRSGLTERRGGDGPEERGREERAPLLVQVERMERAVALQHVPARMGASSAERGAERRDSYPQALPGHGRDVFSPDMTGMGAAGWMPVGGLARTGALTADEIRWAERADRVFRRDSRRYDGGFYLY